MSDPLTYGQLFEILKSLGYVQRSMQWNHRGQWVFEHESFENATIFLPQRPLQQSVDPTHIGTVRATLKAHGVIGESVSCPV